jgi:hypothetical protein
MKLWRAESLNDSPTLIRAIDHALLRPAARLDPNALPNPHAADQRARQRKI